MSLASTYNTNVASLNSFSQGVGCFGTVVQPYGASYRLVRAYECLSTTQLAATLATSCYPNGANSFSGTTSLACPAFWEGVTGASSMTCCPGGFSASSRDCLQTIDMTSTSPGVDICAPNRLRVQCAWRGNQLAVTLTSSYTFSPTVTASPIFLTWSLATPTPASTRNTLVVSVSLATSALQSATSDISLPSLTVSSIPRIYTSSTAAATAGFASSRSSSGLSTGAIVGIVIGAVSGIALAVVAVLFLQRRRKKGKTAQAVFTGSATSANVHEKPELDGNNTTAGFEAVAGAHKSAHNAEKEPETTPPAPISQTRSSPSANELYSTPAPHHTVPAPATYPELDTSQYAIPPAYVHSATTAQPNSELDSTIVHQLPTTTPYAYPQTSYIEHAGPALPEIYHNLTYPTTASSAIYAPSPVEGLPSDSERESRLMALQASQRELEGEMTRLRLSALEEENRRGQEEIQRLTGGARR